jgi:hypothetical protein
MATRRLQGRKLESQREPPHEHFAGGIVEHIFEIMGRRCGAIMLEDSNAIVQPRILSTDISSRIT